MFPTATLTSVTASGDVVTGPGTPNVLYNFMPVSNMGDVVAGAACTGAVAASVSLVLAGFRPVTTLTGVVSGVNPITGVPVGTAVAVTVAVTDLS